MAERIAFQVEGRIQGGWVVPAEVALLVSNARRRLRRRVKLVAWPHQRDAALALADKVFWDFTTYFAEHRGAEASAGS